jgi:cysteine-rich repeat protein
LSTFALGAACDGDPTDNGGTGGTGATAGSDSGDDGSGGNTTSGGHHGLGGGDGGLGGGGGSGGGEPTNVCQGDSTRVLYDAAKDRCYYRTDDSVSATAAATRCQALGGYAAALSTSAERAVVAGSALVDQGVWLGATDGELEGTWYWFNETWTDPVGAGVGSPWASGQPDGGVAANCLEFTADFEFDDRACTETHPALCEFADPPVLRCGDGIVLDEECDDGNAVVDDGCTNCHVDPGSTCDGEPSSCD